MALSAFRAHVKPLLLGLLVKSLYFVWLLWENTHFKGMQGIALWDADSWEYIDTVESWLSGHGWDPDHRMPGYALIYLLFRSWLPMYAARSVLVILHVLVATIATYALARTVSNVIARPRAFWIFYVALLFTSFHALIDVFLVNESLTTSMLIFHWTSYAAFRRTDNGRWLLASGAFIMTAIFLRPIYGPLLLAVPAIELFRRGRPLVRRMVLALLFCSPFIVADGTWTARNHALYGGFHPLTNHGPFNPRFSHTAYYALIRYLEAYGGHCYWWNPVSDIRWYGYEPDAGGGRDKPIPGVKEPPPDAITSVCTRDSLIALAELNRFARRPERTQHERDSIYDVMRATTERYRAVYEREHPFHYQVVSRLRLLKHETMVSGTETLFRRPFDQLGPLEKAYKYSQSLWFWWAQVLGIGFGCVLIARIRRDAVAGLLGLSAVFGLVACPWLMRVAEIRYLIPIFPFLVVIALWATILLYERLIVRGATA